MNRTQRRERRRQIAAEVGRGIKQTKIAEAFGVTGATIWNACREFHVTPPKADDRRLMMAIAVDQGQSVKAVATEYGFTAQTVCKACKEFGVQYRPGFANANNETAIAIREALGVVAELLREKRVRRITTALGTPVAAVTQVKKLCVEAGIPIAGHSRNVVARHKKQKK